MPLGHTCSFPNTPLLRESFPSFLSRIFPFLRSLPLQGLLEREEVLRQMLRPDKSCSTWKGWRGLTKPALAASFSVAWDTGQQKREQVYAPQPFRTVLEIVPDSLLFLLWSRLALLLIPGVGEPNPFIKIPSLQGACFYFQEVPYI